MKNLHFLKKIFFLLICSISFLGGHAQTDTTKAAPKIYVITTNDGNEFMGEIITQDAKEILIKTKDRGEVSIPKYQVKEIKELKNGDLNASGVYIPAEVFSTRYFITTNGLPIEKGESYILWSLWGPDFEFGVADNLSFGIMTSWLAYPVVATAKYSIPIQENINFGVGFLAGSSTWFSGSFFMGFALPFGSISLGDRKKNVTFSGGYGVVNIDGNSGGRALGSFAAMAKVGKKVSLIFDSFLIAPKTGSSNSSNISVGNGDNWGGLLIPGIRLQTANDRAFQFGFAGILAGGTAIPLPIPYVQWFKKL